MAADRVKIVYHSMMSDKSGEQEFNEALEKLGDVEIVDMKLTVDHGPYLLIWYRPHTRRPNYASYYTSYSDHKETGDA